MPYLELTTTQRVTDKTALMHHLSACVSTELGKAETYMMVGLRDETPMLFAGNEEPCAQVLIRALNLKDEGVRTLAQALTTLVQAELGVDSQRLYIVFEDVEARKWAWDGRTFG